MPLRSAGYAYFAVIFAADADTLPLILPHIIAFVAVSLLLTL